MITVYFYKLTHIFFVIVVNTMENIQQITDAMQKGLKLIVRASFQQGTTRLTRLRNDLYSDSFHGVLAWNSRPAKCQCCIATVTVVVYSERLALF